MHEIIKSDSIDYSSISKFIPDVMNALYNEEASKDISLYNIRDAFRSKQMQGKQWLLNNFLTNVKNYNSKILVIGGWLGFISYSLYRLGFKYITEIDQDNSVAKFSKHLNRFNPEFIHINKDVNSVDLSTYNIIINTSCEHIIDNKWFKNINYNSVLFLQSTDLVANDHTNLSSSLSDMSNKYPCRLIYSGQLDCGSWNRFMLVGIK